MTVETTIVVGVHDEAELTAAAIQAQQDGRYPLEFGADDVADALSVLASQPPALPGVTIVERPHMGVLIEPIPDPGVPLG